MFHKRDGGYSFYLKCYVLLSILHISGEQGLVISLYAPVTTLLTIKQRSHLHDSWTNISHKVINLLGGATQMQLS